MILQEGFEISAMEMFYIDKPTAEEFFELYKGVFPEYSMMIDHISTGGPILVMEIRQEDAVNSFRKFCGPHDPE
jgi:nucleoside-diphosphate kinase